MVRRTAMMLGTAFSVSGCGGLIIHDGSRKQSRDVLARAMVERNPELDSKAAADCVVSGMTVEEVVRLGISDVRRVTPQIRAKLEEVIVRPEVAGCIAALPRAEPAT
jgi:hypothetical protein